MKRFFFLPFCFSLLTIPPTAALAHSSYLTQDAQELQIIDLFKEAQVGSFIVVEQNKTYNFLYIHSLQDNYLVLEELNVPAARFAAQHLSWRQWFESGAQGATSWNLIWINLAEGKPEKGYSFTYDGWFNLNSSEQFLATLINLRFRHVPLSERRRIGLPPSYRQEDTRPLWSPPLVVDGQTFFNVPFSAWKARWPSDGTELSNKLIEIYIPHAASDPQIPPFPTYFPYWVEIDGRIGSAKVRVVDSGMNAKSPKYGAQLLSRYINDK